jgi:hypothetical protein
MVKILSIVIPVYHNADSTSDLIVALSNIAQLAKSERKGNKPASYNRHVFNESAGVFDKVL